MTLRTLPAACCLTLLFSTQAVEARYFLPREARFLSPDRAGMIDGPNRYLYAKANPVLNSDPSGNIVVQPSDPDLLRAFNTLMFETTTGYALFLHLQLSPLIFVINPVELASADSLGKTGIVNACGPTEGAVIQIGVALSRVRFLQESRQPWTVEEILAHEMEHARHIAEAFNSGTGGLRLTAPIANKVYAEYLAYDAQLMTRFELGLDPEQVMHLIPPEFRP